MTILPIDRRLIFLICATAIFAVTTGPSIGAEIVMPQSRLAYFTSEPIEIAIAGLAKGQASTVTLTPTAKTNSVVAFTVTGDGSSPAVTLPANSLAPDTYAVAVDNGKANVQLEVSSGVYMSLFFPASVDMSKPAASGGNFIEAGFMESTAKIENGQPALNPRLRPGGINAYYERAIANNYPIVLYQYWTGYNGHKPWGQYKAGRRRTRCR